MSQRNVWCNLLMWGECRGKHDKRSHVDWHRLCIRACDMPIRLGRKIWRSPSHSAGRSIWSEWSYHIRVVGKGFVVQECLRRMISLETLKGIHSKSISLMHEISRNTIYLQTWLTQIMNKMPCSNLFSELYISIWTSFQMDELDCIYSCTLTYDTMDPKMNNYRIVWSRRLYSRPRCCF